MFRNARLRIATALAAITCLLFSQLAVAAYACPPLLHGTEAAGQLEAAGHDESSVEACAEHDTTRPGLCLAHCNPAELSLTQPQGDAPPVMLVALHPLAGQYAPAALIPAAPQFEIPLRGHSPPLTVLHCCFRI